ncbi:MAG: kynurenine 3-monooxygenase, mitochondrial precursor [Sclerophora amabilis]|nr:MAG: kynurenine 3-monooxygenase, mitochondrial precursor [Sclerophora amabilis]
MAGTKKQKTVLVGAGPVGALAALYAAARGDDVEIYELRGDPRDPTTTPLNFTKSINLALSERGINSLRKAQCPGLTESLLAETIPMHGRMIHARDATGRLFDQSQIYDVHGRSIQAVDRAGLNKRLLDELERMPNVTFFFNHKLTGADFNKNLAWFEKGDPTHRVEKDKRDIEIEVSFDFMIGADGAHSAVRYHLMKFARVNYQQEYIDTLWCEFHIPPLPKEGGEGFRLSPNHLHIWPGGDFMFIAIPSSDKSFTCTLFMPASHFNHLSSSPPQALATFFDTNFPGITPTLIEPAALHAQFTENPHLPLISIKCTPYHYRSSCVILGDAAHAMVPFYGQGMNAGFEDVRVLYDCLDAHQPHPPSTQANTDDQQQQQQKTAATRAAALEAYTTVRTPDASCINDLALQNYIEMRSSVTSPLYKARKWIEEHLDYLVPALGWSTQYSRISFGNERYSDVVRAVKKQGKVLEGVGWVTLTLGIGALLGMGTGMGMGLHRFGYRR